MTLQEMIDKLNQQHYRPADSIVASSVMHPIEGLNRASNWLQNQVLNTSQAPIVPSAQPEQAQQATESGLNLAGLTQMGAMPFAPKGHGILGTILLKGMPDYPDKLSTKALSQYEKGASIQELWKRFRLYPWKDTAGETHMLGEIPDTQAKINFNTAAHKLGDVLNHPTFFKNNPNFAKDLNATIQPTKLQEGSGSFMPNMGEIEINYSTPENAISTLMHELTHAQQQYGGIPLQKGTNTSAFTEMDKNVFGIKSQGSFNDFKNNLYKKYGVDPDTELYIPDLIHKNEPDLLNKSYLNSKYFNLLNGISRPANQLYKNNLGEVLARMSEDRAFYSQRQLDDMSPLDTIKYKGYAWDDLFDHKK